MANNPPATIPLWYFNEETGLWVEEGIAERKGNVYVGKVKHFSWHNLDYPAERIEVKGKVTDCKEQPLKVRVSLTGGGASTTTFSDSNGNYSFFAPSGIPLTVTVKSEHYADYSPEVSHEIPSQMGGSIVSQNIKLPCMGVISGTLVNSCGQRVIAAKVWVEYIENGEKKETKKEMISSTDGKFIYRIPLISGQATIFAESLSGAIVSKILNLDGSEQTVTLELCMELLGIIITAADEDGKGFNMAIPNEGFEIAIGGSVLFWPTHKADISLGGRYSGEQYTKEYLCGISWDNYKEGTAKYSNVEFYLYEGTSMLESDYWITCSNMQIEFLSRKGFTFRISLEGEGEWQNRRSGSRSEYFPVRIEGVIDVQINIYNYSWLDMNSHEEAIDIAVEQIGNWEGQLHKDDWGEREPYRDPAPVFDATKIPELPLPYEEVFVSCGDGAEEAFSICWGASATRGTFDDIIQRFKNAGFTVDEESERQTGLGRKLPFTSGKKEELYFEITFDPEGTAISPWYAVNYGRGYDNRGIKIIVEFERYRWYLNP
jgi:hypothetical protein